MGRKRLYTTSGAVSITAQQQQSIARRQKEAGGSWADAIRYSIDLLLQMQRQADALQKYLAVLGLTDLKDATPEELQKAIMAIQAIQPSGEELSLLERLSLMQEQGILRAPTLEQADTQEI